MHYLKLVLPAAVLFSGLVLCTSVSYSTQAYAKKEGKACNYCHVKAGSKDLNDTGKCYKDSEHSLEKCPAPKKGT
jgi:hypothetical protein